MILRTLIGSSKVFGSVIEEISTVAPFNCSVPIQGETGAGKEVEFL
jgi:transcriptional regulator with GAF, ATPase, and Fis domain